jgi:hypothetical protein
VAEAPVRRRTGLRLVSDLQAEPGLLGRGVLWP